MSVAFALALPISLPILVAAESEAPSVSGAGGTSGALLVKFRADVSAHERSRALAAAGVSQVGDLSGVSTRVVTVSALRRWSAVRRLATDPRVVSIESDALAQTTALPNDKFWSKQWGARMIKAPEAWESTKGTRSTVIAIVDTGVAADQPDLRGRVLQGWDFHNRDGNPRDDNGHGTAVAGVAAAAGNDGVGIAGMCWKCRILPVKVLNANGSGSHSNIAAGIMWAADRGADVINLSLATPTHTEIMEDAVAYARRRGSVVVAAAGNEGTKRKFYPAAFPGVISVAASNSADRLYAWSNKGSWIKLAAPGCAYTGKPGRRWSWWCGTSFASPAVAGTAALVKSLRPGMGRSAVEAAILQTASSAAVRTVARGRLDAARAIKSVTPLVHDYEWQGNLSDHDMVDRKAFWLAGRVQLSLNWTGSAGMWMKIIDPEGETVWESDYSGPVVLNVEMAEYRIRVGQSQGTSTSYTLTVDNQ
jgi:subtilisin family serine protease